MTNDPKPSINMSEVQQSEISNSIALIIERSRHDEEMFLVDSKTAATEIIKYLHGQNLLLIEPTN